MTVLTIYEIVGVLVTVVGAAVTYLTSQGNAKKLNATFVGLLGSIFTILFSFRFGIFPEINKHLQVTENIRQVPDIGNLIERLARAYVIAGKPDTSLMGYILKVRLDSLDQLLDNVAVGEFTVEQNEMPDFTLRLITSAKRSFDATSYVQFKEWWDTPWGREYERLNTEAVKRGVKVERTFIFSSPSELETARQHLDDQVKGGIIIRVAFADNLSIQVTSDMVVVDGNLAGELRLTPGKGMKLADFRTRARDVEEIQRQINRLKLEAKPFTSTSRDRR